MLKTWRTSETGDLSWKMLALLSASLATWAFYGAMKGDVIIVGSNVISAMLASYLLIAKVRYG